MSKLPNFSKLANLFYYSNYSIHEMEDLLRGFFYKGIALGRELGPELEEPEYHEPAKEE